MASQADICNLALSFLGAGTITAITDNTTAARVLTAEYPFVRDSELRARRWRFSIKRTTLAALSTAPASGPYNTQFQLPVDCLAVLMAGDGWPGADLSDYRSSPSTDGYVVEGNQILTNLPAPLSLRYTAQITDTGTFDACFVNAFAAMLAWKCCERITQSGDKRKLAITEYDQAIKAGYRANAIEKIPEFPADDSWIMARSQ